MRAILHLSLAIEAAHNTNRDIFVCYLDFKSAYPSVNHTQLIRVLHFLGLPEDFIQVVTNLYRGASTTFLTPHGPTDPISIDNGTLQGDPLSPLLFDLMVEPLIRWLANSGAGFTLPDDSTLASKWYADDATC